MDGLKPGRIVYLVLSGAMAFEINRRRTTGDSIHARMHNDTTTERWPEGAQAHIGNVVEAGEIVPAMVVKVWSVFGAPERPDTRGTCNLKANLDGTDQYWATSVRFDAEKAEGTWHWMFEGQDKRYDPNKVQATQAPASGGSPVPA